MNSSDAPPPESEPRWEFLNGGTHPFLKRAWRSYWVLRHDVKNARQVVLAELRQGTRKLDALPTEVRLRSGEVLQARGRHELSYLVTALCAIRGMEGRADPQLFAALREESAAIERELTQRYEREKRPKGAVGGGTGAKEILLYLLVLRYRPEVVVETGVAQGVSSRYILRAMAKVGKGKLLSVDLPPYNPEGYQYQDGTRDPTYVPESLGVGWLVPPELRDRWDLRLGRSDEVLPKHTGPVDVFFHDSEHSRETMLWEYRWADAHLPVGGFLASDDVPWSTAWTEFHRSERPGGYRVWVEGNIGLARRVRPVGSPGS